MSPRRTALRALFPKEHGLWSWAAAPLLAAGALAPELGTLCGAGAILAAFGAGNAARRGAPGVMVGALTACVLLAVYAPLPSHTPLFGALAVFGAGGAAAVAVAGTRAGRSLPAATGLEIAAILGFAGIGAALATSAGVPFTRAVVALAPLAAFELIGLWWVRGQLARVLPGRSTWRLGPVVFGVGCAASAALALTHGAPALALLPGIYLARAYLTAPAQSGRDARRIGLGEAAWSALVALLASVLVPGGPS